MARADFGGEEIAGMAKLSKKLHVCRLHLVSSPILLILYDVAGILVVARFANNRAKYVANDHVGHYNKICFLVRRI